MADQQGYVPPNSNSVAMYQQYARERKAQNQRARQAALMGGLAGLGGQAVAADKDWIQGGYQGRDAYMSPQQKMAQTLATNQQLSQMTSEEYDRMLRAKLAEWEQNNANYRANRQAEVETKSINQRAAEARAGLQQGRLLDEKQRKRQELDEYYYANDATKNQVGVLVSTAQANAKQYVQDNEAAVIAAYAAKNGLNTSDITPTQAESVLAQEAERQAAVAVSQGVKDLMTTIDHPGQRNMAIQATAEMLGMPMETILQDSEIRDQWVQNGQQAEQEVVELETKLVDLDQEQNKKISATGGSPDARIVAETAVYGANVQPGGVAPTQGAPVQAQGTSDSAQFKAQPIQASGQPQAAAQAPALAPVATTQAYRAQPQAPVQAQAQSQTPAGSPYPTAESMTMDVERGRAIEVLDQIQNFPEAPPALAAKNAILASGEYQDWMRRRGFDPAADQEEIFKIYAREMKAHTKIKTAEAKEQDRLNRRMGVSPTYGVLDRIAQATTDSPVTKRRKEAYYTRAKSIPSMGQSLNPATSSTRYSDDINELLTDPE